MDLKQRSGETVGGFLDRVKIAVDMLHYNIAEAQRDDGFWQGYQRLVIAQFGSGVNDDIREQIIWSEWRLTVIAATVRIALVDILDLSDVDIPAGVFLHPAVGWG